MKKFMVITMICIMTIMTGCGKRVETPNTMYDEPIGPSVPEKAKQCMVEHVETENVINEVIYWEDTIVETFDN